MAKTSKPSEGSPSHSDALSFEDALRKLQGIVESMEGEDLPLETLLARFEEGTRLSRLCQERLAEAEVKIERLEQNAAGEPTARPTEAPVPPPEE